MNVKKMKRVLITKQVDYLGQAEATLAQKFELVRSAGPSEDDLLAVVADVHGIVAITGVRITEKIIQNAPLLEVIATPAVGFDGIDVDAATRAGIPVIANVGVSPESVAEFTVALMVALSRRIVRADRELRDTKDWSSRQAYFDAKRQLGVELAACAVGVVGLGHIGAAVAQTCQTAFSARILGYDPYLSPEQVRKRGAEYLPDVLSLAKQVDFLSLHMPLTGETRHMVDATVLRAMKETAFLVNCSRGAVVDELALIEALRDGWIAGAALDVFETEPLPPTSPLLTMDNVILTPHIAGVSVQSNERRAAELAKRLTKALTGMEAEGVVNPEVWARAGERRSHLIG